MVKKRIVSLTLGLMLALQAAITPAAAAQAPAFAGKAGGQAFFGSYPRQPEGPAEPILWRILQVEEGRATLLSEQVLDFFPAHESADRYGGWERSTLRALLNGAFLEEAFSPLEREALEEAEPGATVSLPDAAMLKDAALGFGNDKSRAAKASAYAWARAGLPDRGDRAAASYWMKDPSVTYRHAQRRVLENGSLGYAPSDAPRIGIRPLIVLRTDCLEASDTGEIPKAPLVLSVSAEALESHPGRTPSLAAEPPAKKRPIPMGRVSTEGFPALTQEGFLPEGEEEFVFIDEEEGLWRYASQDLRVVVVRHQDTEKRLRWLTAQIFLRPGARPFGMYSYDREHMLEDRKKYLEKPSVIMRNHNLVFSMDGDYFIYRLRRGAAVAKGFAVGVEIRDGEILVDSPPSPRRDSYPPLDMMALFEDGDMRVYKAGEKTAEDLLELGAQDVLSFGPYLIRDGEINTSYRNYGNSLQPRAAIGMIQKGHYVAVVVEGRIRASRGMTCLQVADLMHGLGCEVAFNLDGGWTSAMVFMGRQLNQLDNSGVKDNARTQNEVMGIGFTDAYREGKAP